MKCLKCEDTGIDISDDGPICTCKSGLQVLVDWGGPVPNPHEDDYEAESKEFDRLDLEEEEEWREAFHEWVMDRIYATTRMTDVDKIYEKAFNIGLNVGRGVSPKADEYLLKYLLETGVVPAHLVGPRV